jgi:hypothetical protein
MYGHFQGGPVLPVLTTESSKPFSSDSLVSVALTLSRPDTAASKHCYLASEKAIINEVVEVFLMSQSVSLEVGRRVFGQSGTLLDKETSKEIKELAVFEEGGRTLELRVEVDDKSPRNASISKMLEKLDAKEQEGNEGSPESFHYIHLQQAEENEFGDTNPNSRANFSINVNDQSTDSNHSPQSENINNIHINTQNKTQSTGLSSPFHPDSRLDLLSELNGTPPLPFPCLTPAELQLRNEEEIEHLKALALDHLKSPRLLIPKLPLSAIKANMKSLSKGGLPRRNQNHDKLLETPNNFI